MIKKPNNIKGKNLKLTTLGFTLIELLAVITVLAIVLAIAIPRLSGINNKVRRSTFETNSNGIISVCRNHYQSNYASRLDTNEVVYKIENGKITIDGVDVRYNEGEINEEGQITINEDGESRGYVTNGTYCGIKEYKTSIEVHEMTEGEECGNAHQIYLTTELNGGTLEPSIEGNYIGGSSINLPSPTKVGYEFKNWVVTKGSGSIEGNKLNLYHTNVTIYALYKAGAKLIVDKNGGSSNQEFQERYVTGSIIELEDLEKRGYIFTGWEVTSGDAILSGKTLTIGLEDTNIKGTFELASYTCSAGAYLKADSLSCTTCPANSYCPGGTYPYNPDEDQGIIGCPGGIESPAGSSLVTECKVTCAAGTYLKAKGTSCTDCPAGSSCTGGDLNYSEEIDHGINKCSAGTYSTGSASSCTLCVKGSISSAGASSCTACQDGKTTSGAGQSSCNANCDNASNVSTWVDASWNSDNTMRNLCTIATCNPCYKLESDACSSQSTLYVSNSGNDSNGGYATNIPFATIQRAYSCPGNVTIKLLNNITQTSQANFNQTKTVNLTSNSGTYSITRGSGLTNGSIISLSSGTLTTTNVNFNGNNVNATKPVLYISNSATLNLNSGSTVQNGINSTDYEGGGIVINGATMNMNDSTVTNNRASGGAAQGGGVNVINSTFTINSGTISNNNSAWQGGGICVSGGTINIKDGTISGNNSGYGGGITAHSGTINFQNGIISDNRSTSGGGLTIYDAIFNMTGGTITRNSVTWGAGIDLWGGTLNLNAGSIINNNATDNGGAINCGSGMIYLKGSSLTNNTAGQHGGGIYLYGCSLNFSSGTISNNSCGKNSGCGGGIGKDDSRGGTYSKTGGTLSNNSPGDYNHWTP